MNLIGFGRESTPGPATTPGLLIPFLMDTQERCRICGRVDERDRMHFAGFEGDDDATSLYVCDAAHPATE